ncbi:hypothetical protein MNV49_006974 [Pseudohyphozyma bogoriensis]|nr:hypothetical protein MNV49_006974 [Pseudohyphozyma bogoriensis]
MKQQQHNNPLHEAALLIYKDTFKPTQSRIRRLLRLNARGARDALSKERFDWVKAAVGGKRGREWTWLDNDEDGEELDKELLRLIQRDESREEMRVEARERDEGVVLAGGVMMVTLGVGLLGMKVIGVFLTCLASVAMLARAALGRIAQDLGGGLAAAKAATLRKRLWFGAGLYILSGTLDVEIGKQAEREQELEESLEAFKASFKEQVKLVSTLEKQLAKVRKDAGTAAAERNEHLASIEVLKASLAKAEELNSSTDSSTSELRSKIIELQARVASLTSEHQGVSEQLASATAELKSTRSAHSVVTDHFQQLEEAHANLQEEHSSVASAYKTLQATHKSSLAQLKDLEDIRSSLESVVGTRDDALIERQQEIESQASTITKLRNEARGLADASASSARKVEDLVTAGKKKDAELAALAAQLAQAKADFGAARTEGESSAIAAKAMEESLPSTKTMLEQINKELAETKSALVAAESRAKSFQQSLEAAKSQADTSAAFVDQLQAESARHAARAKELEVALASATAEAGAQTARLAEVERKLEETIDAGATAASEAKQELEGTLHALAKAQEESTAASEAKTATERSLVKSKASVAVLERDATANSTELGSTKAKISSLEQSLNSARKDHDRVTLTRDELESTSSTLTASLEELRESAATLSSDQSSSSERAATLSVSLEQKEAAAEAAVAKDEKLKKESEALCGEVAAAEEAKRQADEGLQEQEESTALRATKPFSTRPNTLSPYSPPPAALIPASRPISLVVATATAHPSAPPSMTWRPTARLLPSHCELWGHQQEKGTVVLKLQCFVCGEMGGVVEDLRSMMDFVKIRRMGRVVVELTQDAMLDWTLSELEKQFNLIQIFEGNADDGMVSFLVKEGFFARLGY